MRYVVITDEYNGEERIDSQMSRFFDNGSDALNYFYQIRQTINQKYQDENVTISNHIDRVGVTITIDKSNKDFDIYMHGVDDSKPTIVEKFLKLEDLKDNIKFVVLLKPEFNTEYMNSYYGTSIFEAEQRFNDNLLLFKHMKENNRIRLEDRRELAYEDVANMYYMFVDKDTNDMCGCCIEKKEIKKC